MKKVGLLILSLFCLWMPEAVSGDARSERADTIRESATITFTGQYEVACSRSLVEAALEHPLVMGVLWASYGYAPAYTVTGLNESGAVHVKDPTGIAGDVWPVSEQGNRRVYLAEGKLDHWAVPALNRGAVVFDIRVRDRGAGTGVTIQVYMAPESRIAGAALWVLSPIVKSHINNRITLNFQDVARILEEIETRPDRVAGRLQGEVRQVFEEAFAGSR